MDINEIHSENRHSKLHDIIGGLFVVATIALMIYVVALLQTNNEYQKVMVCSQLNSDNQAMQSCIADE